MGWHDSYIHGFHSGLRPERGEFDFLIAAIAIAGDDARDTRKEVA